MNISIISTLKNIRLLTNINISFFYSNTHLYVYNKTLTQSKLYCIFKGFSGGMANERWIWS